MHASGSAGTQAELAVGLSILAPEVELIGIDIDAEPERVRADVDRVAGEAAALLEVDRPPPVTVTAGYAGPSYGVPTPAMIEAVRLAARLEGLVLDPVYSGKGFACLVDLVRRGRFKPSDKVLFWHTGGVPGLFAYRSAFA